MIAALVRVYNSATYLAGCLDSIVDKVDRTIVGDGWFPWKYAPGNESMDETETIARRYRNIHWIPAPERPYANEVEKNNRLLEEVPDDSWVLYIDPDQRLIGDVRQLVAHAEGTCSDALPMRIRDSGGDLYYCTLFKKRKGVRFERHDTLRYDAPPLLKLYMGKLPEDVYYDHVRPP